MFTDGIIVAQIKVKDIKVIFEAQINDSFQA